jgi:hypothetical protein
MTNFEKAQLTLLMSIAGSLAVIASQETLSDKESRQLLDIAALEMEHVADLVGADE